MLGQNLTNQQTTEKCLRQRVMVLNQPLSIPAMVEVPGIECLNQPDKPGLPDVVHGENIIFNSNMSNALQVMFSKLGIIAIKTDATCNQKLI